MKIVCKTFSNMKILQRSLIILKSISQEISYEKFCCKITILLMFIEYNNSDSSDNNLDFSKTIY